MANLMVEINALFLALVGGSPGAEGVFLNQNLAVRSTSLTVPDDLLIPLLEMPGDAWSGIAVALPDELFDRIAQFLEARLY